MDIVWRTASGSPGTAHPIQVSPGLPDSSVEMRLGPHDKTGWSVPVDEWRAFVEAVKAGEFDDLAEVA